jgi:arylsulfatase A-like enzyme
MDERIGRLLAKVDALGMTENTVVILQSDHGHSTEERTFGGGGNAGPYRGAKFSLFEGGIRVPAIISFPTGVPQGAVRDQFAVSVDWLPTIAELTGASRPERVIDGRSLVPVIKSADATTAHDEFHWQSGSGLGGQPQWAVRQGNWKLLGNPKDTSNKAPIGSRDALFLVDLASDVGEMHNVAAKHVDVVERLSKLHEAWLKDVQP